MSVRYKVDFNTLEWESPGAGVRHKYLDQEGTRLRLVEYSKAMPLHWCEKGHRGYLLEGILEIEYENETAVYRKGDGVFIPDGPEHKHRGRVISDTALLFFIENI